MNFDKIKQEISISTYLKSIGCNPKFENESTARYIAPYRADSDPSLNVNNNTNLWYDHGLGRGGNVIQLAALINNCSDYEACKILMEQKDSFSFHCISTIKDRPKIEIKKVKYLENRALLQYLHARKVNISIAQRYCKEIYYSVSSKRYFAIAFENDSRGYELRSIFFKGCTNKNITHIKNESKKLILVEGFIDFLSLATYKGIDFMLSFDTIVLNSVSNIKIARPLLSAYQNIYLYLDNDPTGKKLASKLLKEFSQAEDSSFLYEGYKDFNDFIINKNINC